MVAQWISDNTVLNLIQRIGNFENVRFSGKGRQSVHIKLIINIGTRIRKILIYCVKLDHALYLIIYGNELTY